MKHKITIALSSVILMLLLVACGNRKKAEIPEVSGRYTVWVGGDIVQVGIITDTTYVENDMLVFVNKRTGKKKMVPLCNIGSIDSN